MKREELLKMAYELKIILVKKEVSPKEAEIIAEFLLDDVREENEKGKEKYMVEGKFG